MNKQAAGGIDLDDTGEARSDAPHIRSVIEQRYSRRSTLFGGMAATGAALFGLSACSDGGDVMAPGPPPSVTVGAAINTTSGRLVTLNASAVGAGPGASVMWTQVLGPTVALTAATTTNATFIAPSVAASTQLVFRFTAAAASGATAANDASVVVGPAALGFASIAKSLADVVTVPAGHTISVLYRLGDPINAATPAYANTGADTNFAGRAGDHHDGLYYFGLAATGPGRDDNGNQRGVLVMNHENITQRYLHENGPTGTGAGQARPEAEARKEMEAHGLSAIEVVRTPTGWTYVQASAFNRRITPFTSFIFTGPARGAAQLYTAFSTDGTRGRGTINNCANGFTLWGTNLTCEENYGGYFRRDAGDDATRGGAATKAVISLNRNDVRQGATGAYGWSTVVPAVGAAETAYRRWNATAVAGQPADGTGDFRNEPNHFGWVVETDPYDPASVPRKRTALGRMAHEGAWPSNFVPGQRPVFYMGDDARGEYIYKFVSATPWVAADAAAADRMAIGDKYLDAGVLHVARFDATGTGQWLPLVFGQGPLTAANAAYAFSDQADVLINARLAADALRATPMDRPEWGAVNPRNGEIYFTLTNNNATLRPITATDAANPRHYNDPRGAAQTAQRGNPNGHIIRMREAGGTAEATTFTWDIYLFGAGSDLDPTNINISQLNAGNDFSSPDGLWFGRPQNASGLVNPLLWIQTDDGAFTDQTNCMMLAAMPGVVGDGAARTITNTAADGSTRTQATLVGKAPGLDLRRFLVGPVECEITGVDSTPDGRTLFVNIQHPGESTSGFPTTFPSNWPASQSGATVSSRPRSATIVITKDDGGVVGL
ncbi:alkaline phosphatase PhoX [Phenylobacterium sp.]|uniref:PhoX family protein n=1 Tax=Phenylobacterium sp. TaxID=1871053 RepID=UPI0039838C31